MRKRAACLLALAAAAAPAAVPAPRSSTSAAGAPATNVTWQAVNTALDASLFEDDSLWDDVDSAVAGRLRLPLEGRTRTQASFRSYPAATDRIAGARPYSTALYAKDDRPAYLSVIFINKGDYEPFRTVQALALPRGDKEREFRDLESKFNRAIDSEGQRVAARLGGLFGEPRRMRFGQGKTMQERVSRWDWKGHTFLLAVTENEGASLRIMPPALADARGKALEKVTDARLRASLASRVERRTGGDVVVTEIPMANQGPKGYCVPATWERYLRYLDIPADMYSLAIAGQTEKGGGTSIEGIVSGVRGLVSRQNRSIQEISSRMKLASLSDYIDAGLPIMWAVYLDPGFNRELSARTAARRQAPDMDAWKKSLEPARRGARKIKNSPDTGHVCMIIGYNATTGEIAVSDSWGPGFEERWLTVEEADAMSQGRLYIVGW